MPCETRFIGDVMHDHNARRPTFELLADNVASARISFIQPQAEFDGTEDQIAPTNLTETLAKLNSFLRLPSTLESDLVVVPEYYAPWELLQSINSGAIAPATGKLWVFGFNGITPEALATVERSNPNIEFEYDREYRPAGRILGPVCYIFTAEMNDGRNRVFCVIQFKTHPMAGEFEANALIRHRRFYIFNNESDDIRLATLICADALNGEVINNFNTIFPDWNNRAYWLLHLQLNEDPRNEAFRNYRLQEFGGLRTIERKAILCVNWARHSHISGSMQNSQHYGMSALYLRLGTRIENPRVDQNHVRGAYYSRTHSRLDAVTFNFLEACYCFDFGKITHQNLQGPQSVQRLPQMNSAYRWEQQNWQVQTVVDDQSHERCPWRTPATASILDQSLMTSPLKRELLMLMSAGYLKGSWAEIKSLDSIVMRENEAIRRLTYLQDNHDASREFRDALFSRFSRLIDIIRNELAWPPLLPKQPTLTFIEGEPFFNARIDTDVEVFIVYLGEATEEQLRVARSKIEKSHRHSALRKYIHIWWDQQGVPKYQSLSSQSFVDPESENSDSITEVRT